MVKNLSIHAEGLRVALARTGAEVRAAQRLRYDVFVRELGGDGPTALHGEGREADHFDDHARHLLLLDPKRPEWDRVVGAYRLLDRNGARAAGGFYSEGEFDLSPLLRSGRPLLELGRSCLHPDYRAGAGMMMLWQSLARLVMEEGIDLLFGTASFHGTDTAALAQPLSFLHHRHLAPESLRPVATGAEAARMDLLDEQSLDRRAALREMPQLIRAYLRLGGVVGQGAWIDRALGTTDVCVVLDIDAMDDRQRAFYEARP